MSRLFVLNPGSRSGRGRRRWAFWQHGMKRAGAAFETVETRTLEHAREVARSAAAFETVVAVGGDGTINAVLAGMADARVAGQRMAVLYAGTSPDFCRFHGIPTRPAAALDVLLTGRTARIDAASIEFAGPDGVAASWFACSCNIGLGAVVAATANRLRPRLGDRAGTAMAVLHAIATSKPVDIQLDLDGRTHALPQTRHLIVLKNPWIASGLRVNVDRRPDDGRLTVMAVTRRSRLGLCALLPAFYSGAAHAARGIVLLDATRINVRADIPCDLEFDGDPHGRLPAAIQIRPRCIELVCRA